MNRTQKQELVTTMRAVFERATAIIVVHYKGLTVTEINTLRAELRKTGASFMVTKNSLTRLALEGSHYTSLSSLFSGQTAVAYSQEEISVAKVVARFAKDNNRLVVVGAGLSIGLVMTPREVLSLAELSSLPELRASVVNKIQVPAARVISLLRVLVKHLIYILKNHPD